MKTLNITEIAARYGMTAMSAERLLVKVGWMVDGEIQREAVRRGFVTDDREVTPRGQGYLSEISRD